MKRVESSPVKLAAESSILLSEGNFSLLLLKNQASQSTLDVTALEAQSELQQVLNNAKSKKNRERSTHCECLESRAWVEARSARWPLSKRLSPMVMGLKT